MMTEEERISKLNYKIINNKKKIRNINLYESTISTVLSGTIILGGFTLIFKNYDNLAIRQMSPNIMLATLALSCAPIIYVPSRKNMLKKTKYEIEIQEALNELHTYAIKEDEKIMNKKRNV